MIASVITDTSIFFIAQGRPWTLAVDHPAFAQVKARLTDGSNDEEELVRLTDVRVAVDHATEGRAVLSEDGLFLDGEQLPGAWQIKAAAEPSAMRVLIVGPGDRVLVEGDEDAPDGEYTVGDVDNDDTDKRVMVESEEGFFGFVANASIKTIVEKGPPVDQTPFAKPEAEPSYEAEDCGCSCNDSGMDSEWNWEPDQNAYICNGCGEVQ